jgi:hypothetical protein
MKAAAYANSGDRVMRVVAWYTRITVPSWCRSVQQSCNIGRCGGLRILRPGTGLRLTDSLAEAAALSDDLDSIAWESEGGSRHLQCITRAASALARIEIVSPRHRDVHMQLPECPPCRQAGARS